MGDHGREWTAEIRINGNSPLYAWLAYNKKFDAFATDNPQHARVFKNKEDVEAWIERLHVKDAKPIRLKG